MTRIALRGERGSALMLVPAGVLVLVMLGAIAVDSAVVALAQRDLTHRTAAVANDIAAFASDEEAFYGDGVIVLVADEAARYAAAAFGADRLPAGYRSWGVSTSTAGPMVRVEAWAEVDHVFARALPGVPRSTRVRAVTTATARTR